MEKTEEELREEFYERFKLGYFSLNTPTLIRKDFFDFLTKIRREAIAESNLRVIEKVKEMVESKRQKDKVYITRQQGLEIQVYGDDLAEAVGYNKAVDDIKSDLSTLIEQK